jgi:hypothetical protein
VAVEQVVERAVMEMILLRVGRVVMAFDLDKTLEAQRIWSHDCQRTFHLLPSQRHPSEKHRSIRNKG